MTHPSPEPVTARLAARVRDLRTSTGLSQTQLGERMAEHGYPWSRTTVAKLEAGRRGSVSVGELLALALLFGVPLVWLLADPETGTAVPIANGVEVDPWTALLWLIGKQPLNDRPGGAWDGPALVLERLYAVVAGVDEYRKHHRLLEGMRARARTDDDLARRLEDVDAEPSTEKYLLESIAKPLLELEDWSLPVPPLPSDVMKRAAELDIKMPGQED